MSWTRFMDMHSGGSSKEPFSHIYIEAPEQEALVVFYNRFGHNAHRVTCACCDYSTSEYETIDEATSYERGLRYVMNPSDARYLEPGEAVPDGFTPSRWMPDDGLLLDEYLARADVCIIRSNDILPRERHRFGAWHVWR